MRGNVGKQRIAAGTSERVVDVTETVKVDQGKGDHPVAASRQCGAELFQSRALIGQSGQRVLGCTAFLDCKVLGCKLTCVRRAAVERAHHISAGAHGWERAKA